MEIKMELLRCGQNVYAGCILFSVSHYKNNKIVIKSRNFNLTDYKSFTKLVRKLAVPFLSRRNIVRFGGPYFSQANIYGRNLS